MSQSSPPSVDAWLDEVRAWTDRELDLALGAVAPGGGPLCEAMRYALLAPGKRLRPALVVLACESLGGARSAARPSALAVELVHTYSLVHDDLPCMDDDALRRGRPTCHVVFGEALALLAGDALLTAAFELLAAQADDRIGDACRVLAAAIGARGMVGGQALDLTLQRGASSDDVAAMHRGKTGALIRASVELGAIAAGAPQRERGLMCRYGEALGACFQAVDDVLDVTGDAASLGKTPGKDDKLQRATLVAALGLEGARDAAQRFARRADEAAVELGFGPTHLARTLVAQLAHRSR